MKLIKIMFLLLTLTFMGCINIHETINVKKNGSGTIKVRMLVSNYMKQTAQNMGNMIQDNIDNNDEENAEDSEMFSENEMKKRGEEFGEGVTYISSKPIKTKDMEGFEMLYSFKDINKLSSNMFSNFSDDEESDGSTENKTEPVKKTKMFSFKKGHPSQLKIEWDNEENTDNDSHSNNNSHKNQADMNNPMMQGMGNFMTQMFKGFKIKYDIVFDGKIVKTNANFKEGNKITLLSLDFENLMKNPNDISKLNNLKGSDKEEMIKLMKTIKNVKVDTNKEIIVKFK